MTEQVNEARFNEILSGEGLVFCDFWASWCGPCRMMAPEFEKASETATDVKFIKVNVDDEGALAMKFGIDAIPCAILFKGGKAIDRHVGYGDERELLDFIDKNR